MKGQKNRNQFYKSVFSSIIESYQELRSVNSSSSIAGFYRLLGKQGGKVSCTGTSKIVQPLVSDFICDVEIAARRSLSKAEHQTFTKILIKGDVESMTEQDRTLLPHMQRKLGQAFVERRIYPVQQYFQARDLR